MTSSVYVHIPFCRQKCQYCDFVSYAGAESLYAPYIAALCREIAGRGGILSAGGMVDTVFIGGGTPSILPAPLIADLFACLRQNLPISPDAEVTVEVNPGTIDAGKLSVLREAGVNRLSLGVQSFDDTLLRTVGRIHSAQDAELAVQLIRRAGFEQINLDLMHGLPGQTPELYRESLARAIALGVEHISAYSLIVEDETPLARQLECGAIHLPEEEEDAAMFDMTHEYLTSHGYEHYEISNYARPKHRCRHNLAYWRYQSYAGFGVAACSFEQGKRFTNTADVSDYIEAIQTGSSPVAATEELDQPTMMAEYAFLALRTSDGVIPADFTERFALCFREYYRKVLTNLIAEDLVSDTGDRIWLTRKGLRFGNRVFMAFLPDQA